MAIQLKLVADMHASMYMCMQTKTTAKVRVLFFLCGPCERRRRGREREISGRNNDSCMMITVDLVLHQYIALFYTRWKTINATAR